MITRLSILLCFGTFLSCSAQKQYDPWNGLTAAQVKDSITLKMAPFYVGNIQNVKSASEKEVNQLTYKKLLDLKTKEGANFSEAKNRKLDSIYHKIASSDTTHGKFYIYSFSYIIPGSDKPVPGETSFINSSFDVSKLRKTSGTHVAEPAPLDRQPPAKPH